MVSGRGSNYAPLHDIQEVTLPSICRVPEAQERLLEVLDSFIFETPS